MLTPSAGFEWVDVPFAASWPNSALEIDGYHMPEFKQACAEFLAREGVDVDGPETRALRAEVTWLREQLETLTNAVAAQVGR